MTALLRRWLGGAKGFKPRAIEEPIDYYWHRPLAQRMVRVLTPLPVTPNQVSVASGVASLLSGIAIGASSVGSRWWAIGGALLLLLSIVLDCADGQLARVRGQSSAVGRIVDGTIDAVAPLAVFHGMAFVLIAHGYPPGWVWSTAWAAGLSLMWHCSLYDVGKNVHLHATAPQFPLGGETLLSRDDLERMKRELRSQGESFYALLMTVWSWWTAPQLAASAPWRDTARCPQNARERALFVELFGPPMRGLRWLGLGTHLFLLTAAAICSAVAPEAIVVAWLIIIGPLNVLAAWCALVRPRRERTFTVQLKQLRAAAARPEPTKPRLDNRCATRERTSNPVQRVAEPLQPLTQLRHVDPKAKTQMPR